MTDERGLHRALGTGVVVKQVGLKILRTERVTELRVTPKEAEA